METLTAEMRDTLKKRVMECSKDLPTNYIELISDCFPEYKDTKAKIRVRNVKNLTTVDEKLTNIFEALAELHLDLKKKLSITNFSPAPAKKPARRKLALSKE